MGKRWKQWHFILLGSKITDGDCSHEIKRHFLLGRKAVTNLGGILKSRDITLPTNICIAKTMVFPVVMYGYESWTINKAEHRRTDAFELWCWRRGRRQWHPTPVLLPGKSHGRRSLEGCSPWCHWGSDTTEQLHFHFLLSCIGEGNGNPLQCSSLENPRDGGAWWAPVSGGRTELNRTEVT